MFRLLMPSLLLMGLVCAVMQPAQSAPPEGLQQHIDRLHTAISAHQHQIATQQIVVHFKESAVDISTESRAVGINGNVVMLSQIPQDGKMLPLFHDLPSTLTDPLHLLPNQFEQKRLKDTGDIDSSLSIEGVGKTVFRLLRPETLEGTVYEVLEFVQHPPTGDLTERDQPGLVCTKIVCKLYIGKDGLIQRKTGVLSYRVTIPKSETGKAAKKSREQSATFESTRIEYRDAPVEELRPPAPPTPLTPSTL